MAYNAFPDLFNLQSFVCKWNWESFGMWCALTVNVKSHNILRICVLSWRSWYDFNVLHHDTDHSGNRGGFPVHVEALLVIFNKSCRNCNYLFSKRSLWNKVSTHVFNLFITAKTRHGIQNRSWILTFFKATTICRLSVLAPQPYNIIVLTLPMANETSRNLAQCWVLFRLGNISTPLSTLAITDNRGHCRAILSTLYMIFVKIHACHIFYLAIWHLG